MRRCASRSLAPTVLVLALGLPAAAWGNISGSWEGNITNERGEHIITAARLVQESDKVTGEVSMYGAAAMPICNGVFDGQVLRFEMGKQGQTCAELSPDSLIRFEGRQKGPSLSGTADDGKIKGSFFWIQVEEATGAEPTPDPALPPTPKPVAVDQPTPGAGEVSGVSPYEITRAFIAAVRGEDPAAFVAVWNSRDRNKDQELLRLIFSKKKMQLRAIADSLETKLSSDAFQLQDKGALLEYPCTGSARGKTCIFTVALEDDGRWYVEDFD